MYRMTAGAGAHPTLNRGSRQRGSILVTTCLFLVIFLMIGALGIDVSRYLMKSRQVQDIADGAVLAAAQAFDQPTDDPDLRQVRSAMLTYIKNHQTDSHLNQYEFETNRYGQGFMVRSLNPPSANNTCTRGFAIRNGSIVLTQPGAVRTRVLGSAITYGAGGPDVPVTTRIEIERNNAHPKVIEPWGDYDDPSEGNVNTGGSRKPYSLSKEDEGSTVALRAQSWVGGNTYLESRSGDDQSLTLSDGDDVPDLNGFDDQADMESYVQDYVADDGTVELESNQAIVFFELGATDSSSPAYDLQDLVLLITVNPSANPTTGNQNYYSTTAQGSQSSPCPPYTVGSFRVGVLAYGNAGTYFLPREIFGITNRGIVKKAVAHVEPRPVFEMRNLVMNCGVYGDDAMMIGGNNFDAAQTDFCGNSTIDAGSSNNGVMGNVYTREGSAVFPPGGGTESIEKFPDPKPIPHFTGTNPTSFDVNLSEFDSWTHYGYCSGGPGGGTRKALRTQGGSVNDVVWTGGGGGPVCVEKESDGDYEFGGNNNGTLQRSDGSAVSIYADGDVYFTGNGKNTVKGGIYSEGNIIVTKNGYTFDGDPSVMGGLALWSEKTIDVQKNNTHVRGILGAEGDLTYGSSGGGTGPVLEGIVITHGSFALPSNSNSAAITHEPLRYNPNYLNNLVWESSSQPTRDRPRYSNVSVRLVE